MSMSVVGHYNNFFFAAHLLDVAMGFKTLRTILSSVTHNGKQVRVCVVVLFPHFIGFWLQFALVWRILKHLDMFNNLSAGPDCGAVGRCRLPLHCSGLQLLQEVLQQERGQGHPRHEVQWHAYGEEKFEFLMHTHTPTRGWVAVEFLCELTLFLPARIEADSDGDPYCWSERCLLLLPHFSLKWWTHACKRAPQASQLFFVWIFMIWTLPHPPPLTRSFSPRQQLWNKSHQYRRLLTVHTQLCAASSAVLRGEYLPVTHWWAPVGNTDVPVQPEKAAWFRKWI